MYWVRILASEGTLWLAENILGTFLSGEKALRRLVVPGEEQMGWVKRAWVWWKPTWFKIQTVIASPVIGMGQGVFACPFYSVVMNAKLPFYRPVLLLLPGTKEAFWQRGPRWLNFTVKFSVQGGSETTGLRKISLRGSAEELKTFDLRHFDILWQPYPTELFVMMGMFYMCPLQHRRYSHWDLNVAMVTWEFIFNFDFNELNFK